MKAIFLDMDGVMNNCLSPGVMHWNSTLPHCVENLNEIVDNTDAKIFLITSWVDDVFFIGNNEKFLSFLYERGFKEDSIGGFRRAGTTKEEGILELIQNNASIENFIILDDNADIVQNGYLKSRHIKTESLVGLTTEEVQKAIQLLND